MENVEEKFVSDDGVSEVPAPITPEGGEGKKDKLKKTTTEEPKGAADDKKATPGQADAGKPVPTKDGGEGKKGDSAKDHTPTDNIKVEPKKA